MDKRIVKAKIDLMLTSPFWGSLVTRLELADWEGNTFATNGKKLFCPEEKYITDWTFKELVGVLAHETWHCAGGHIFRMKEKQHMRWNVASDLATNYLLLQNNYQLPKGGLTDPNYDAMTAEKIYALLPKEQSNNGNGDSENSDGESSEEEEQLPQVPQDLLEPDKSLSGNQEKIDAKELEQEWKESLTSAIHLAKGKGNMPSGMEEYINDILTPKVSWQEILYRYLQIAKGNTDYTTYPFHRSHIHREIYLPSLRGEMIEIACGVDTSGSISRDDLTRYFSELRGICSIFGSYTIHFFQCDAKVHSYEIITEDTEVPTLVQGRGGTNFVPFFDKVLEEQIEELPVVYFTDLDGNFPDNHYGDGVFWLVRKKQLRNGRDNVPFGTIVEIDD
jgi:predicted metal-dependent peptidase|tara:strand:+ start:4302 stop:5474 length:1173 start_codon:yes stop_codon:yes gene_type:complete